MPKLSDLNILDFGNDIQLVGCVYAGKGRALVAMLPGEQGELPVLETLDMDQADWERLVLQTDLLETEVSAQEKDGTISKVIARKSARQVGQGVSWNVYRRDAFLCRYCGGAHPLTVDHVICWENFGPSTEANLLASCRRCNRTRGNTPYEEWLTHPYYLKVSEGLTDLQKHANISLAATLGSIPRLNRVKSHR